MAWIRLDTDFYHDPKFLALQRDKGKNACFDCIRVWCLCHENYGVVDINDHKMRLWLEEELGIRGKRLASYLKTLADCELIDPEEFAQGRVTSKRLKREGLKRKDSEDKARYAAEKRWEGKQDA